MNPIDSTTRLASLIRRQVRSARGSAAADTSNADTSTGGAAPRDLASLAARRIALIGPDNAQREEKALRIFLETTLLAEFGEALLSDPAFGRMVDAVQERIEADDELSRAARDASRILLSGRKG